MTLKEWAEQEVQLAIQQVSNDRPNDCEYDISCLKSALKAFYSLLDDDHSGMSITLTQLMLNKLIDCEPLTPVQDDDKYWYCLSEDSDSSIRKYQNSRLISLFKYVGPDGTTTYNDTERFIFYNITSYVEGNPCQFYNGSYSTYMHTLYPIRFPYTSRVCKVFVDEFLYDSVNGDFDTVCLMYMIDDAGTRIDINKYLKEVNCKWVEISKEEYDNRKLNACSAGEDNL